MSKGWRGRLVLAAGLALGLIWWLIPGRDPAPTRDGASTGPQGTPALRRAEETPAARAPAGEPGATRISSFKRGARTRVPKLAATPSLPPAFDAGLAHHPRQLDRGGDGPIDKRPPEQRGRGSSDRLRQELRQRLDTALDGAQACLESWAEQDDSLASGVMLAFTLDARGLQDVWIMDREGVPGGPLACIANSVYPIDWSGLAEAPMKVTVPVKYQARDSG